MKVEGEHTVATPRERVWTLLRVLATLHTLGLHTGDAMRIGRIVSMVGPKSFGRCTA